MDDFIEQALKPVLWEEAEQQAAERRRQDKRSTAKGREGEPLSTNVEELYQIKCYYYANASRTLIFAVHSAGHRLASAESTSTLLNSILPHLSV